MLELEAFKDLMGIIENVSNRIHQEHMLYKDLFEDFQGLNKGLCVTLDDLVDTLDKHMGSDGLVSWFVFDSDFGKHELSAGHEGSTEVIDTVDKLYAFIIKTKERDA